MARCAGRRRSTGRGPQLSEPGRRLLTLLVPFCAPIPAAVVAGLSPGSALEEIEAHRLVQRRDDGLILWALVRDVAARRGRAPDLAEGRDLHRRWCHDQARWCVARIEGPEESEAKAELHRVAEDLRSLEATIDPAVALALYHADALRGQAARSEPRLLACLGSDRVSPEGPWGRVRICCALARIAGQGGRWPEALHWAERALEGAGAVAEQHAAHLILSWALGGDNREGEGLEVATRSLGLAGGSPLLRARSWGSIGALLLSLGRLEDASEAFQQMGTAALEAGDTDAHRRSLINLAGVWLRQGRIHEAEQQTLEGLTGRNLGRRDRAICWFNLSFMALEDRPSVALDRAERAIELMRACGARDFESLSLGMAAVARGLLGLEVDALDDVLSAMAIAEDLGYGGARAVAAVLHDPGLLDRAQRRSRAGGAAADLAPLRARGGPARDAR